MDGCHVDKILKIEIQTFTVLIKELYCLIWQDTRPLTRKGDKGECMPGGLMHPPGSPTC